MKNRIQLIVGGVMLSFALTLGLLYFAMFMNETTEDKLLRHLSDYEKNANVVYSGDCRVYLYDKTITVNDIREYNVKNFLFATKEKIFFYTSTNNHRTITVYKMNHDMTEIAEIFSKTHDNDTNLFMYDDQSIYILAGGCYKYNIAQNTTDTILEEATLQDVWKIEDEYKEKAYSVTKKGNGTNTSFTITRKSDRKSKTITDNDLRNFEQASQLNNICKVNIDEIVFNGYDVFLIDHMSGLVTVVYEYDFETSKIGLYDWRDVIDAEALKVYIY